MRYLYQEFQRQSRHSLNHLGIGGPKPTYCAVWPPSME
jgi:hypothetical protein